LLCVILLHYLRDPSNLSSPAPHFKTFQVYLCNYFGECNNWLPIWRYLSSLIYLSVPVLLKLSATAAHYMGDRSTGRALSYHNIPLSRKGHVTGPFCVTSRKTVVKNSINHSSYPPIWTKFFNIQRCLKYSAIIKNITTQQACVFYLHGYQTQLISHFKFVICMW
jgi:hypothetical protein